MKGSKTTRDVTITLPEAVTSAPEGVIFCATCGVIRTVTKATTERCLYDNGQWLNLDSIDIAQYSEKVATHRQNISEYLGKWGLTIPPNVEITLFQADKAAPNTQEGLLMKAHIRAESFYYKMWGDDKIEAKRKKGPPMPEDVKEMLRQRRNKHPEPINIEPLMSVSLKAIKNADLHGLRQLYFDVYGAEAGANLTADNMRRSLEYAVKELIEMKKRPKGPDDEIEVSEQPVATSPTKKKANMEQTENKPSKPKKLPLFEDKSAQAEREKKYPWVVKGSWRQDPEHETGTLVDIACQTCGTNRTVHAADLFQVKLCTDCRDKKGAKKNGAATGDAAVHNTNVAD